MESLESKKARQKELLAERIRQISRNQSLKVSEPPVPHTLTPVDQTFALTPPQPPPTLIPNHQEIENARKAAAAAETQKKKVKLVIFIFIVCPITVLSVAGSGTVLKNYPDSVVFNRFFLN